MKYLPLGWLIKLIDVSVLSHLILYFLGFRLTIPRWLLQTSSRNTMCNRRKQQRKKIFLRNSQQTSSWETLGQTRSQAPTNQLLVLICHLPPSLFLVSTANTYPAQLSQVNFFNRNPVYTKG